MRLYLLFILLAANFSISFAQNVGIGTNNPDASAKLEVKSNNSGFLPPRMTYSERNAIVSPATGLLVYCTDCANGEMQFFNGTDWERLQVNSASIPRGFPTITTKNIDSVSNSFVRTGGNIISDGGSIVSARGVVWSTSPNPTIALPTKTNDGFGLGEFTSNIVGINLDSTFYFRSYATNNVGTAYGNAYSYIPTLPTSYLTKTAGTIWNFRYTDQIDSASNKDYTVTCLGRDSSAFGKNYAVYSSTSGGNLYKTSIGSNYYHITNIFGFPYENKYLSDNDTVGTTWIEPINSNSVVQGFSATLTANVRNTILSKRGILTINGKIYTDVIKTKVEISNASISIFFSIVYPITITTQNVYEYYAPKYGLIKRTSNIVAYASSSNGIVQNFNINNSDELMSSSIQ